MAQLPDADYTTVGGYVFGELGRLPKVGDRVKVDGGVLEVVEMEGRRVSAVRIGGGAQRISNNDPGE